MDNEQTQEEKEKKEKKTKETQQRIKKYLELENVSILAGAGASYHLGIPTMKNSFNDLKKHAKVKNKITKYFESPENKTLEDLLNCLQADRFIKQHKNKKDNTIDKTIKNIQRYLFKECNIEQLKLTRLSEYIDEKLRKNTYHYHEILIKKLLQRPNNLKRVNLFTTNYDMAFDYALDNLGVHYINGFMGVHNRCFRPEIYDYDLYYPGQTVAGKVHRAEKVLKYYKLHGSLSWVAVDQVSNNTYGIKEIPLNKEYKVEKNNELIIYPCATKKSFTLDLPYSELFRQFSHAINQDQSVLFCIGYSFNDEHVNDIIKQALSIPSFTLVIVNYDQNEQINIFKNLEDKRVITLNEKFTYFVEKIMPDLYDEEVDAVNETVQKLYSNKNCR